MSAKSKKKRTEERYAGELCPVEMLSPDGAAIRSDGAILRAIEITPPNPETHSGEELHRIHRAFELVLSWMPPNSTIQFYAEAAPLELEGLRAQMAADREAGRSAISNPETRDALRRLGEVQDESIARQATRGENAAVRFRTFIIVPYEPDLEDVGEISVERLRTQLSRQRLKNGQTAARLLSEHREALLDSRRLCEQILDELQGHGIRGELLDGPGYGALLARRFQPSAVELGVDPSITVVGEFDEVLDAQESIERAEALKAQIAAAPLDLSDHRCIRVERDLEIVLYLSSVPPAARFGWLTRAMRIEKPFVLTVLVKVLDRNKERTKQDRRSNRLFSLTRGQRQRGRPVNRENIRMLNEADEIVDELDADERTTICEMIVLQAVREPSVDETTYARIERTGKRARRDLREAANASIQQGSFEQRELWLSSLPVAQSHVKLGFKVFSPHAAATTSTVGARPGAPSGIPTFYSRHNAIENQNFWHSALENHLSLLTGRSGTGKTFLAIDLALAHVAYGVPVRIADRAGHYRLLCDLIPTARHIEFGADDNPHHLNPWDVADFRRVPDSQISHLVELVELTIGRHDPITDSYVLDDTERSHVQAAIRAAYDTAAKQGRCATHSDFHAQLIQRRDRERADGNGRRAELLDDLAERTAAYVGTSTYSWVLDRPTTIPENAPLIVYDLVNVPERQAAAVMYQIIRQTRAEAQARAAARQAGLLPADTLPGTLLFADECWKLMTRPALGSLLDDSVRRARHWMLAVLAISQQLSDFDNSWGKALLTNASIRMLLHQDKKELDYLQNTLKVISAQERRQILELGTVKRKHSRLLWQNGPFGTAVVEKRVGSRAYWIATSDPNRDAPLRADALRRADADVRARRPEPDLPLSESEKAAVVWKALDILAQEQPL